MNTHADKTSENKSQAVANSLPKPQSNGENSFQFVDNRPEAIAQREMQEMANNSLQVSQLRSLQKMANNNPQAKQTAQFKAILKLNTATPFQQQNLNGITHQSPIQLQVGTYQSKKLRSNAAVFKDLNHQQQVLVQKLHEEDTVYTVDEARLKVGAAPIKEGTSAPFPFRYDKMGPDLMDQEFSDKTGHVSYSNSDMMDESEDREEDPVISAVVNSKYEDLQKGSTREISQIAVMGNLSPNVAAQQFGLEPGPWEWLHLVAFSIKQTHVGALSGDSIMLVESTQQPQQIRENLVLGTAGANTAMLTYETFIKNAMRSNPELTLQLWVAAEYEAREFKPGKNYPKINVKIGKRIHYHFIFTDGVRATPPFVLSFDARLHKKPTLEEFDKVTKELQKLIRDPQKLNEDLIGIKTGSLVKM